MKEGKQEEKNPELLFPRLHVNDREKGGPRAPPRNKMAVYEQFNIPSFTFNSSASSSLPPPPQKGGALVTSACSTQLERTAFTPSDVPAEPSMPKVRRVHFQSSGSPRFPSTRIEVVRSSRRQTDTGSLTASESTSRSVTSVHQSDSSNAFGSCRSSSNEDDDFVVPTFLRSRTASSSCNTLSTVTESERIPVSCDEKPHKSSSSSSPNSCGKRLKGIYTNNARLKDSKQHSIEQRHALASIDKDTNRIPDSIRSSVEPSIFSKISSDKDDNTCIATASTSSMHDNPDVHPENCDIGDVDRARYCIGFDSVNKGENSRVGNESFSNSQIVSTESRKLIQCKHVDNGSPECGDVGKNEVSDFSISGSISSTGIRPDDVVGVIGPKHFWKARRAIVNQQRTFAIQLFELHRLIKVQKLLAASPDVIKVDIYLDESPTKAPMDVMPPEDIEKYYQSTIAEEASAQIPNKITDCTDKNTPPDPNANQNPANGPSQLPSVPDNRPHPWCFQPEQNQWLVAVMSPSEGLIYKPCMGPRPTTAPFMAPFYGSYVPPGLPPIPADFINPSYGGLPAYQQLPFYFQTPYGIPVSEQIMSSHVINHVNSLAGLHPAVHEIQEPQISSHLSNPRSEVISGLCSQASKGSELRESTLASSPENAKCGDTGMLPLDSSSQGSDVAHQPSSPESANRDDQNRVIKVVPRAARLATESAARIFRFIQEGRKQYDT